MATNRIHKDGQYLRLVASDPAAPNSGDPVLYGGSIPAVALIDELSGGTTTMDFGSHGAVYDLSVQAVNDSGNSAVALGDTLYYTSGDSPVLSKKQSGVPYGTAMEAITAGQTATIQVMLRISPSAPGLNVLSISQDVVIGDFTDGGGASGFVDLTSQLPAGAIPLAWKCVVDTAFTGGTAAAADVQLGVSGDVDRFSAATDQSVFSGTPTVGSSALGRGDSLDGVGSAQTVRVTVSDTTDFSQFTAGAMTVILYYIATA